MWLKREDIRRKALLVILKPAFEEMQRNGNRYQRTQSWVLKARSPEASVKSSSSDERVTEPTMRRSTNVYDHTALLCEMITRERIETVSGESFEDVARVTIMEYGGLSDVPKNVDVPIYEIIGKILEVIHITITVDYYLAKNAKNIYILNKNNVVSETFQDFPIESDGSECHIQHREIGERKKEQKRPREEDDLLSIIFSFLGDSTFHLFWRAGIRSPVPDPFIFVHLPLTTFSLLRRYARCFGHLRSPRCSDLVESFLYTISSGGASIVACGSFDSFLVVKGSQLRIPPPGFDSRPLRISHSSRTCGALAQSRSGRGPSSSSAAQVKDTSSCGLLRRSMFLRGVGPWLSVRNLSWSLISPQIIWTCFAFMFILASVINRLYIYIVRNTFKEKTLVHDKLKNRVSIDETTNYNHIINHSNISVKATAVITTSNSIFNIHGKAPLGYFLDMRVSVWVRILLRPDRIPKEDAKSEHERRSSSKLKTSSK
ncbi:hypothetical protein YC2023_122401 [Brassica napus]